MFDIRSAQASDVPAAIVTLGDAFVDDPLMHYFFRTSPVGVRTSAMAFFSILMRARIELEMPALVLRQGEGVLGVAMGYDTSRPDWPQPLTREFHDLEASVPGLADRLAAYERVSSAFEPPAPHYYLGVLGVHPQLQGQGAGGALIDAFCRLSSVDSRSAGVYLETGSASSLRFYLARGFDIRGEGKLEGASLWCVFKLT